MVSRFCVTTSLKINLSTSKLAYTVVHNCKVLIIKKKARRINAKATRRLTPSFLYIFAKCYQFSNFSLADSTKSLQYVITKNWTTLKKVNFSTCYSASYMRRTQYQKRFTILEVAADWHELMIPQHTMRPSISRANEQLDPRFAASRHTIAPISHTKTLPRSP